MLWCLTCIFLKSGSTKKDIVRGRIENLMRFCFKIIWEELKLEISFPFKNSNSFIRQAPSLLPWFWIVLEAKNIGTVCYQYHKMQTAKLIHTVVRRRPKGLKQEAGLVQSRSYNFVTKAHQVPINLAKCLLQNYGFYHVPVQFLAFIFFVSFLLPYGSFFCLKTENLFYSFELSGN